MIRVRRPVPADLEALQQLLKKAGVPMDKAMGLLMEFMVCQSDESIIGFGCLKPAGEIGYLNWVYINEASRKDKLGNTIVKALLNSADLKGVRDVYAALSSGTTLCSDLPFCDAFLRSLRFELLSLPLPAVQEQYSGIFGSSADRFYHVSLVDYFKSCC